jgi:predicted class III extradiol MEMO1 family dioxygenase
MIRGAAEVSPNLYFITLLACERTNLKTHSGHIKCDEKILELLIGNYEKRFAEESKDDKHSLEFLKILIQRLEILEE